MRIEHIEGNDPKVEKTLEIDYRVRTTAMYTGMASLAVFCVAPHILVPTALASGIVFHIADRRIEHNRRRLKNGSRSS